MANKATKKPRNTLLAACVARHKGGLHKNRAEKRAVAKYRKVESRAYLARGVQTRNPTRYN